VAVPDLGARPALFASWHLLKDTTILTWLPRLPFPLPMSPPCGASWAWHRQLDLPASWHGTASWTSCQLARHRQLAAAWGGQCRQVARAQKESHASKVTGEGRGCSPARISSLAPARLLGSFRGSF